MDRRFLPLIFLAACSQAHADPAPSNDDATIAVRTVSLRSDVAEERLTLHGVVRGTQRSRLSFAIPGRLQHRLVEVGAEVEAGQPLLRLDAQPYRHAVTAANARLEELNARQDQLERDQVRVNALHEEGVASQAQLENVTTGSASLAAGRQAATAQLQESRRQRRETVLRAPFDGVVVAIFAEVGTVVGAGAPVLAIEGQGGLEVVASVPDGHSWLSPGTSAEVSFPRGSDASSLTASVTSRATAPGPDGLYAVRIALPAGAAQTGTGALIQLHRQGQEELRAPLRAILDPSGEHPFVWAITEGTARRVPVEVLGLRSPANDSPEVALRGDALTASSRVVVEGSRHLLDGDAVEELSP